jgi:hypothetical protein
MHSYLVPGIRFNDYLFTDPVPLSGFRSPKFPGLLAILTRNPQWGPKPLQALYFGELGSIPATARHDDLLVAVLPMPYSNATQRRALCRELISAYSPMPTAELTRKVEELEARQQEQSQQILSLLTYIGKLFEPLPVGPRKPLGFMPQVAAATESGS